MTARRLVVAVTLAVASLVTATPGVDAQSGVLGLVAQTPFVPSEGTFEATLSWSGSLDPELTIGGLIYAPIADETDTQPVKTMAAIQTRKAGTAADGARARKAPSDKMPYCGLFESM